MRNITKWTSEVDKCDICKKDLKTCPSFIDGITRFGTWGLMCPTCHAIHGQGLGIGYGQQYNTKTREQMVY